MSTEEQLSKNHSNPPLAIGLPTIAEEDTLEQLSSFPQTEDESSASSTESPMPILSDLEPPICSAADSGTREYRLYTAPPSKSKKTHKALQQLEDAYIADCHKFGAQIDAGVIVCLRYDLCDYKPSIVVSDNDLIAICNSLCKAPSKLRRLDLSQCKISGNGAYLLYGLLQQRLEVEELELRNNALGDNGGTALALILRIAGSRLRFLGLHWNRIGEMGARQIAQSLLGNYILEELDISHNALGSAGARAIRSALARRSSFLRAPLALDYSKSASTLSLSPTAAARNQSHSDSVLMKSTRKIQRKERRMKLADVGSVVSSSGDEKTSEVLPGNGSSVDAGDDESQQRVGSEAAFGGIMNADFGIGSGIGYGLANVSMAATAQGYEQLMAGGRMAGLMLEQIATRIRKIHGDEENVELCACDLRTYEERLQILLNLDGNFLREEIMNSVTHGLGIVLSVIAAFVLMSVAYTHSVRCIIATWIYAFTLVFLYTASTTYHSCFLVTNVRVALRILDYSAIFLLIAGTYTPVLVVGLQHSAFHSCILLAVVWLCAVWGVVLTAVSQPGKHWKFFTALFVGMSFAVVFAARGFFQVFDPRAFLWLLAGGVFYIGGIAFVAMEADEPIFHAVWHLCVLGGSACHYFCILFYVLPMDSATIPFEELTLRNILNNVFLSARLTDFLLGAQSLTTHTDL